jgi:hypothetical protein
MRVLLGHLDNLGDYSFICWPGMVTCLGTSHELDSDGTPASN